MCEWHQLMYIAIITPSKPTSTKPKMPIFRPNNITKNYPYLSSIFNPNNLFKNEKSTFTANLKVRPWYLTGSFPLNAFRGLYFSHFIRPSLAYLTLPRSRPKRIKCRPSSATSKISNPLNILLLQIALVGPWIHPQSGQRDNFTRGPPCLLHSMFGDSVSMKPPLTPVFFQRLASTYIPA